MQVILLEKVINLGQLGDIVKVKDGYARNFLIPQGKARRATEAARKEFELRRAELEKAQSDKLGAAQALAARIGGQVVKIAAKVGVDGRLFGSITNSDIADALQAAGFGVEKGMIRMPAGPLKTVGSHALTVGLLSDVTAEITVDVAGEAA